MLYIERKLPIQSPVPDPLSLSPWASDSILKIRIKQWHVSFSPLIHCFGSKCLELISSITLLPPVVMPCCISYMSVQSPSPLLTHTLPKTRSQHCLLSWCLCLLDTYHIFRVFKPFPFWGTLDIGCWKPYLFPGTPITLHLGPLAFWGLLGKWRDLTFQKEAHKLHHSRTWWEQRWVKQN